MSTNNNKDTETDVPRYFQPELLEAVHHLFETPEFRIIGQTAVRAYQHLQDRTNEQLNYLASTITWLLYEAGKGVTEQDDEESLDQLTERCHSQWLNLAVRTVDIRQQDELPDARWPEYFAMLALQALNHAMDCLPLPIPDKPDPDNIHDAFHPRFQQYHQKAWLQIFPLIQTAQMALSYADAYAYVYKNDGYTPPKEATIKLHAHKGGIKKNAKTNALKREFIIYCQEHQKKPSVRELATRFYQELPEDRQRLLTPTNAERTLCDAMTNHEKGRLPKHFWDN